MQTTQEVVSTAKPLDIFQCKMEESLPQLIDGFYIFVVVAFAVIVCAVGIPMMFTQAYDALKIKVAPRVYLVEWVMERSK